MVANVNSVGISSNVISPKSPQKTHQDIVREKQKEEVLKIKLKPESERTTADYLLLALDKLNDINVPVVHAQENQSLNYYA